MVLLELARLRVEQVFGIAQVSLEIRRHLRDRVVHGWEDALPGLDDRIVRIRDVESHRAVIGVHNDLDAVADVVERIAREAGDRRVAAGDEVVGVRVGARRRVRVEDVDEPAGRSDDEVWILVVAQVGRDRLDAILDRSPHQQLAAAADLITDQKVQVAESSGEQQLCERRVQLDASGAGPGVVLVSRRGRRRVVELLGSTTDDHVVRARLRAEVDPRLGDHRRAGRRNGWYVLDDQKRVRALARVAAYDLVDRQHGQPDAVGVDQMLVHPAGVAVVEVRDLGRIELAAGEHHLAHARRRVGGARRRIREGVSVRVHVAEAVVVAQQLHVVERRAERPVVPQAQVLDRRLLVCKRCLAYGRAGLVWHAAPAVEVESEPRHVDVVLDVGRLLTLLVRVDRDPLGDQRVGEVERNICADPQNDRQSERDPPASAAEDQEKGSGKGGQDGHYVDGQEPGVDVRVAGSLEYAALVAVHERVSVELESDCYRHQEQHHNHAEMDAGGGRHRSTGNHGNRVASADEDDREQKQGVGERLQQPIERQLEDVEADVQAEGRVVLGKRNAMGEQLDRLPAGGHQAPQPEGDERTQTDEGPEDRAGDVGDLDVGGRGAGAARRTERTAAVAAGVAIEVEAIEEIVEREPPHLALGNDAAGQPEVEQ